MKNKELIVKFAPVARKNLNKTFFTLFIIVILESLCSALFVGTSLLLNSMQDSFAVTFFSYSLMFCGVFFWFLILEIAPTVIFILVGRKKEAGTTETPRQSSVYEMEYSNRDSERQSTSYRPPFVK